MASENPPSERPRLDDRLRQYSSKLDELQGPLRTTSDGNLIDEDTGDWLILDTPPHDDGDKEMEKKKGPAIGLPESKNGATGLDNPRARKPLMRLLRNRFSGSDRLPVEQEGPEVVAKRKFNEQLKEAREQKGDKVDMNILTEIQKHYGSQIGQSLGGDWFEVRFRCARCTCETLLTFHALKHALVDAKFWRTVLDKASSMEFGGG